MLSLLVSPVLKNKLLINFLLNFTKLFQFFCGFFFYSIFWKYIFNQFCLWLIRLLFLDYIDPRIVRPQLVFPLLFNSLSLFFKCLYNQQVNLASCVILCCCGSNIYLPSGTHIYHGVPPPPLSAGDGGLDLLPNFQKRGA